MRNIIIAVDVNQLWSFLSYGFYYFAHIHDNDFILVELIYNLKINMTS